MASGGSQEQAEDEPKLCKHIHDSEPVISVLSELGGDSVTTRPSGVVMQWSRNQYQPT